MVLKLRRLRTIRRMWFENDVKMYGTQTLRPWKRTVKQFENDVKMYGTQTAHSSSTARPLFENDVKMYGTQTYIHG